jgi:hypothetical protein
MRGISATMNAEMRFKQTISESEKRKAITFRCQKKRRLNYLDHAASISSQ